jgi:hypothetical protein
MRQNVCGSSRKNPSLLTATTFLAVAFVYNQNQQQSCQEKIYIFLLTGKINESLELGILKFFFSWRRFIYKLYGKHNHVLTIIYRATVRNFEFISGVFNVIEIMHKHTTRD